MTDTTTTSSARSELLAEVERLRARVRELEAAMGAEPDLEYGIRTPDGEVLESHGDRGESEARLGRYRDTWPDAVLVVRRVYRGPWTAADAAEPERGTCRECGDPPSKWCSDCAGCRCIPTGHDPTCPRIAPSPDGATVHLVISVAPAREHDAKGGEGR